MISRVKGTQDFLDLKLFNFTVDQIAAHVSLYNFTPIMTPIIEYTELFQRSLGLETDVVSKEMFILEAHEAKKGMCLRPEATASTVRAFIENKVQDTPWKVYSWGPMFRYERPQKGRYRQFFHFNLEVIGAPGPAHDVQLIVMLDRLFAERFKLDTYALHLNFLGCYDDRASYKQLLKEFLDAHQAALCTLCQERKEKNIMRVFDCKNEQCQRLYQDAPELVDHLCTHCAQEWAFVQEQLSLLSVSFSYRPTLVRGLDYYNKTVFEFVSTALGAQNAFCGGGRYDQLVAQLGGKNDLPCIGAAIGLERLLLLLEPMQDQLGLLEPPTLYVIMPLAPEQHTVALLLADELRAHNYMTELFLEGSIKNMMRKANQQGAGYALLLGQEEQEKNEVTVKNMRIGTQERIPQAQLVDYLRSQS